jgi:hypothetical protein
MRDGVAAGRMGSGGMGVDVGCFARTQMFQKSEV